MLNASIRNIPIPSRMSRRPISDKGFPVPWFVGKVNGAWDFRAIDTPKIAQAYHRRLCWLCGEALGQYLCFVIGPMCSINRVSSEPPSHRDCAEYAARACPFLARPNMRRNEKDLPGHLVDAPGIALEHNPGVTLIWITKSYRPISAGGRGVLFEIGEPIEAYWYREGRTATRAEIEASIAKGLPYLREIAATEGYEAMRELDASVDRAKRLIPAA
jgi:hypothetical protein